MGKRAPFTGGRPFWPGRRIGAGASRPASNRNRVMQVTGWGSDWQQWSRSRACPVRRYGDGVTTIAHQYQGTVGQPAWFGRLTMSGIA